MSNIESGFCDPKEYTAFEEQRRMENELYVDELCLMMFSLKTSQPNEPQAAKKPSRITGIERRNSGLHLVNMTILNDDLNPDCITYAMFKDGYRVAEGSQEITVGGYAVRTAYLKSYYGSFDDELRALMEERLPPPPAGIDETTLVTSSS